MAARGQYSLNYRWGRSGPQVAWFVLCSGITERKSNLEPCFLWCQSHCYVFSSPVSFFSASTEKSIFLVLGQLYISFYIVPLKPRGKEPVGLPIPQQWQPGWIVSILLTHRVPSSPFLYLLRFQLLEHILDKSYKSYFISMAHIPTRITNLLFPENTCILFWSMVKMDCSPFYSSYFDSMHYSSF